MPHTIENATVGAILAQLQHGVAADPACVDQLLLADLWARKNFGEFIGHEFTEAAWRDFVDFCSHQTVPWVEWFEQWHGSLTMIVSA